MKLHKGLLSALLCLSLSSVAAGPALAAEPAGEENDIVILHTNDVHCGIEEGLTYAA